MDVSFHRALILALGMVENRRYEATYLPGSDLSWAKNSASTSVFLLNLWAPGVLSSKNRVRGGLGYNFRHRLKQALSINSLTYSRLTTDSRVTRWAAPLLFGFVRSVMQGWVEEL